MPGNGSPVPFPPVEEALLPLPPPPDPPAAPACGEEGSPPAPPPGAVMVPAGKIATLLDPFATGISPFRPAFPPPPTVIVTLAEFPIGVVPSIQAPAPPAPPISSDPPPPPPIITYSQVLLNDPGVENVPL